MTGPHGIRCNNHDDLPMYHETEDDVRFCRTYGPVVEWSPTTTGITTRIAHEGSPMADQLKEIIDLDELGLNGPERDVIERALYAMHRRGWNDRGEADAARAPREVEPLNWHDLDVDSFAHWAVVAMITDGQNHDLAQNVIDASDSAHDMQITLEINGIRFPGMPFFQRLWEEMMRQADLKAAAKADEFIGELVGTKETVEMLLNIAAGDIRRRFREAGLPMKDDDDGV